MAPSNNARVKASKLRAKVQAGKTLTAEENGWLAEYERNSVRAKAKKAIAAATTTTQATAPVSAAVRGPQLALDAGGSKLGAVKVNVTVPVDSSDRMDPKAQTWIPTMPETPKDAEPPVDGAPKPPPVGTPLVDPANPVEGAGDPHAAEQFAGFMMAIMHLGIAAGRELAADLELPDFARAVIASDEHKLIAIGHVGQATQRLAMKYGLKSVPLADEVVVAAALVASGAAIVYNQKRKQLKKGAAPTPTTQPQEQPQQPKEPEQPSGGLNELWRMP